MPKISYECEFCGKKFQSEQECKTHEKSCNGNPKNMKKQFFEFFYDSKTKNIQIKKTESIDQSIMITPSNYNILFVAGPEFPYKGYAIVTDESKIEQLRREYKRDLIIKGTERKKDLSDQYAKINDVLNNIVYADDDDEFIGIADVFHKLNNFMRQNRI